MERVITTLSGERLLMRRDAAKLLGVTEVTVSNWVKAGILHPVHYGQMLKYRESECKAILEGKQM